MCFIPVIRRPQIHTQPFSVHHKVEIGYEIIVLWFLELKLHWFHPEYIQKYPKTKNVSEWNVRPQQEAAYIYIKILATGPLFSSLFIIMKRLNKSNHTK